MHDDDDDSRSTQFEPGENDGSDLWEVEKIMGEKNGRYLIKWKGVDENGEPWDDSWVPKFDVTDDTVQEWKAQKRERALASAMKKKKLSTSQESYKTHSKAVSRRKSAETSSTHSASTTRRVTRSSVAAGSVKPESASTVQRSVRSTRSSGRVASPAPSLQSPTKRKRQLSSSPVDPKPQRGVKTLTRRVAEVEVGSDNDDSQDDGRPRKKRKLRSDVASLSSSPPASRSISKSPTKGALNGHRTGPGKSPLKTTFSNVYDEIPRAPSERRSRSMEVSDTGAVHWKGKESELEEGEEEEEEEDGEVVHNDTRSRAKGKAREVESEDDPGPRSPAKRDLRSSPKGKEKENVSPRKLYQREEEEEEEELPAAGPSRLKTYGSKRSRKYFTSKFKALEFVSEDEENVVRIPVVKPNGKAAVPSQKSTAEHHRDDVDVSEREDEDAVVSRRNSPRRDQLDDDAPVMDIEPPDMDQYVEERSSTPRRSPSVDDVEVEAQLEPEREEAEDGEASERHSSPVPANAAEADVSFGTIIPETQLTKANTSSENSSQPNGHHIPSSAVPSQEEVQHEQTTTISDFTAEVLPEAGKANERIFKGKGKLGPIPVVTPSKFGPHVKKAMSIADNGLKALHAIKLFGIPDSQPFSSSIESQSTQAASHQATNNDDSQQRVNGVDENDADDEEDEIEELQPSLELKQRGRELAEMDRIQRRSKREPRKPLDILMLKRREDIQHHEDEPVEMDEDAVVQQMQDEYMNLDEELDGPEILPNGTQEDVSDVAKGTENEPLSNHIEESRHISQTTEHSHQEEDPQEHQRTPTRSTVERSGQPGFSGQNVGSPIRQLDSALSLLNQKSEEIHDLRNRMAEDDQERERLLARIAQLEKEHATLTADVDRHAHDIRAKDNELETLRAEKGIVIDERDKLVVELHGLKIAKEDVEKEALIFREQYGLASAQNDELRSECKELSGRVTIAEKQVTEGVDMVRRQYEGQLERLNRELEKSQITAKILLERDRRTEDEVRRVAATVPALEAKIEKLEKAKLEQKEEINALIRHRNDVLVSNNELTAANAELKAHHDRLQEENTRVNIQNARYTARERYMMKLLNNVEDADDEDYASDDEVFLCEWAANGSSRCGEVFRSRENLQDHLFNANHL